MAFQCGAKTGWEWVTGAKRLPARVEATAAWVPGDCSFSLLPTSLWSPLILRDQNCLQFSNPKTMAGLGYLAKQTNILPSSLLSRGSNILVSGPLYVLEIKGVYVSW